MKILVKPKVSPMFSVKNKIRDQNLQIKELQLVKSRTAYLMNVSAAHELLVKHHMCNDEVIL